MIAYCSIFEHTYVSRCKPKPFNRKMIKRLVIVVVVAADAVPKASQASSPEWKYHLLRMWQVENMPWPKAVPLYWPVGWIESRPMDPWQVDSRPLCLVVAAVGLT